MADFLSKFRYKKRVSGCVLLLVWMLSSCSSLTTSQLAAVRAYAEATKQYSRFPGQMIEDYVEVQSKIFLLGSPLIANPDRAANRIFSHHVEKTAILEEAEKMDLAFAMLREYAIWLEILASRDHPASISSGAGDMGDNLDYLIGRYNERFNTDIPVGLGNIAQRSLVMAGSRFLDRKRAEYLREYLEKGTPIIREITETTKTFLEENVSGEWLQGMDKQLKSAHTGVRRQVLTDTSRFPSNSFSIIQLDTQVDGLYDEISRLKKTNDNLIASIGTLYPAHQATLSQIQEKKKLTEILGEVSVLVHDVRNLMDLYHDLP